MRTPTRIAAALAAATVAAALAGCTGAAASSSDGIAELDPDQEVDIVFESYNLAQAGLWSDTINDLIDQFEQEHPNIHVTGQPADLATGGVAASVQKEVLAGNPPDVAQIVFNELDFAVTKLGAANLTELVGEDALDEHFGGEYPFHERARVLADWDGATYGIPYVFSTPILWIDETLLEQAGIDPATVDLSTWDAVERVATQVTAHTGAPSLSVSCLADGGGWCMQSLFRSNGGAVLSDDRTTIEFGSDAAVEAVERMRELHDAGVLANEDATTQAESFSTGKTALTVTTSVYQAAFLQAADAGGWTLNATALPAFGSKPVVPTNSGSALMVFSTDPVKQAAAWELIKFFTSATAYEAITSRIGYLPLRPGLTEEGAPLGEWMAENPLVQPNLDQLDALEPWVSYPGNSYQQVETLLFNAIDESVFYGSDPEATLTEAARRAQELIEE